MGHHFSLPAKKMQALSFALNEKPLFHHFRMDPDRPFQDIGDRLNQALEDAGYTKARHSNLTETLSNKFGVKYATISDWRKGKKCPTMKNAIDISKKLDICVEWLLTGRGRKRPGDPEPHDNGDNGDKIIFDMTGIPAQQKSHFAATLHAFAKSIREVMVIYK